MSNPEDTEHLANLSDGAGCTEIWEHLSEQRAAAAADEDAEADTDSAADSDASADGTADEETAATEEAAADGETAADEDAPEADAAATVPAP